MSIRTRTRSSIEFGGAARTIQNGVEIGYSPIDVVTYDEECEDIADSPGVDHTFDLFRYEMRPYIDINPVNGSRPTGQYTGSGLENLFPSIYYSNRGHISISGSNISANDFAALQARTNPSRPVVTPLTLIQDVKDLPKMLKDAGRLMKKVRGGGGLSVKDIANQNLATQFGWLPLIDDIEKVLNLQTHINRKIKELDRLYTSTGLKRRITLGKFNAEQTITNQYGAGSLSTTGRWFYNMQKTTHVEKWGTIRWKPTIPPQFFPDTESRIKQAKRLVTGLTPEGLISGAWDVLPWTWLTDWFVNVGDYMLSHSNSVPATSSHKCVMRRTTTVAKYTKGTSTAAWIDGGDGATSYVSLERNTDASSVPFASMPFIGLQRLSILGSLFIQRFK